MNSKLLTGFFMGWCTAMLLNAIVYDVPHWLIGLHTVCLLYWIVVVTWDIAKEQKQ